MIIGSEIKSEKFFSFNHPNSTIVVGGDDSIYQEALKDLIDGAKSCRLWSYIALNEIKLRYRRTVLGPFWITLNLAIFVTFMGLLFSSLWKISLQEFFPYFSAGYISWIFISSMINESSYLFVSSERILKQMAIPYSLFAWVSLLRNLILLLHHSIVYIAIVLIFHVPINFNMLLLIPGLFLVSFSIFWLSLILGLLCARFRDFQLVISNLMQIVMFFTPLFWSPSQLAGIRSVLFVDFNPLYYYISVLRLPLLGQSPPLKNWLVVLLITLFISIFSCIMYAKQRRKLVYWL